MSNTNDMRRDFEAWWEANMNTEEMDLHRHIYPGAKSDWSYACHETHRSWMTWQAATERATAKWLPIETAPKNMEDIDIWCRLGRITDCSWNRTTYGKNIGFVYESDYDCNGQVYELVPEPTHWMPLPPQPAIRQGGDT